MWAAQYLRFEQPRRWLTSGGAGTMGYGLPAAIGAQVAHPDSTVVCVSGDASVLMNIQELSTALQHRPPVKVVLSNNGYMGMVRQWQQLNHGKRSATAGTRRCPTSWHWPGHSAGAPAAWISRRNCEDALADASPTRARSSSTCASLRRRTAFR